MNLGDWDAPIEDEPDIFLGFRWPDVRGLPAAREALSSDCESVPNWLARAGNFGTATADELFSSRVVYYPGAGIDGQSFKVFCGSHSAHCVVHADYHFTPDSVLSELKGGLKGYSVCQHDIVPAADLLRWLGRGHDVADESQWPDKEARQHLAIFAPDLPPVGPPLRDSLWAILQREPEFDAEHGPERLAFLHVCAEAVWLYRFLWAQAARTPYAIVLQDHGFGGNLSGNEFGGDGRLYRIARDAGLPQWLLVGENTFPWQGYEPASCRTEPAGSAGHRRCLCRRQDE